MIKNLIDKFKAFDFDRKLSVIGIILAVISMLPLFYSAFNDVQALGIRSKLGYLKLLLFQNAFLFIPVIIIATLLFVYQKGGLDKILSRGLILFILANCIGTYIYFYSDALTHKYNSSIKSHIEANDFNAAYKHIYTYSKLRENNIPYLTRCIYNKKLSIDLINDQLSKTSKNSLIGKELQMMKNGLSNIKTKE